MDNMDDEYGQHGRRISIWNAWTNMDNMDDEYGQYGDAYGDEHDAYASHQTCVVARFFSFCNLWDNCDVTAFLTVAS